MVIMDNLVVSQIADAILMLILTTEYAIFFKSKYAGRSGEWK